MSLVRQLFSIAIGRNPSTPSDLRAMARQATVHVAGVNSPLFMSTLLFDILNAPTVVSRNATLKLLGFMIRKVSVFILCFARWVLITSVIKRTETACSVSFFTSSGRSRRQVSRSNHGRSPRNCTADGYSYLERARQNVSLD